MLIHSLALVLQVGIVALNLIGEPIGTGPDLPPGGYLQLHPPVTREVRQRGSFESVCTLQSNTDYVTGPVLQLSCR